MYVKHVNEILETKIESLADLRNIFDDIRKHAQEVEKVFVDVVLL